MKTEQGTHSDVEAIASTILDAFNKHYRIFLGITQKARERFIKQDWQADAVASGERIHLYSLRVNEAVSALNKSFKLDEID